MQKHSVLINCSRGGTVEESALITALKSDKISYAGIDVFESEPAFNKSLTKLKNVILSPHLAGKTVESKERMSLAAAEKIINFYKKSGNRAKLIN
jgi:D-3-phosphoglycerate dehydrogenase